MTAGALWLADVTVCWYAKKTPMRVRLLAVLLVPFVTAAGCGEGTQALPDDVGHTEFLLQGARTLSFDATAPPDPLGNGKDFVVAAYAQGYPNSAQTVLDVAARDMTDSIKSNRVFLRTPKVVVGSYAIGADCTAGGPAVCGHVALWLNEDYRQLGSGESFILISGEIHLVATYNNRVQGAFTGTARQRDALGVFLEPAVLIEVRAGSFDVPLSPN